jgi:hypothetical protein
MRDLSQEMLSTGKKTCSVCKEVKVLDDFYQKPDTKAGYASRCKECQKLATTGWRRNNPDKNRVIEQRFRENHAEKLRRKNRAYYQANREFAKQSSRDYYRRLKDAAYQAYGGYVCACCGEAEPMFLCLDHVNNDGNAHRAVVKPYRLYKWLQEEQYPTGFLQVLCFNCNQGKRLNGGVCPHQKAVYGVDIEEV